MKSHWLEKSVACLNEIAKLLEGEAKGTQLHRSRYNMSIVTENLNMCCLRVNGIEPLVFDLSEVEDGRTERIHRSPWRIPQAEVLSGRGDCL